MAFKDLTDTQVLDLDDVDVEDIIAREIMEQGVKKVDEPVPFLLQKPIKFLKKTYGEEKVHAAFPNLFAQDTLEEQEVTA